MNNFGPNYMTKGVQKHLFNNVNAATIHTFPKLEAIQMFINDRKDNCEISKCRKASYSNKMNKILRKEEKGSETQLFHSSGT